MTDYGIKDRIYGACALIPHPTDPNLFLGVSRKDDPTDFTLPGGKLEKEKNRWRAQKNGYEKAKRAAAREIQEETGVNFSTWRQCNKILYTGLDENGNKARCFIVKEWHGEPEAKEPGTVVKWCTWDELCQKTFEKYNKKVRAAYEKLKLNEDTTIPMIGKEITKMSKVKWKVAFDEKGNMMSYVPYSVRDGSKITISAPYVFEATMKILKRFKSSTGRVDITLLDVEKNTTYNMSGKELYHMTLTANIQDGTVAGFWSFSKNSGPPSVKFFMSHKED